MNMALIEQTPDRKTRPEHHALPPDGSALYVATDLRCWETATPRYFDLDVGFNWTCYRRLDPLYYAWLRHQMKKVKDAAGDGDRARFRFETLRNRFNPIQEWAMRHFKEEDLLAAARTLNPNTYVLPSIRTFLLDF